MSKKIFIGIRGQEAQKQVEKITTALEEKYIECYFELETKRVEARGILETKSFDLIIVDNDVLPSLQMYENIEIPCPVLYICPSYKGDKMKNLTVFQNVSEVLQWIKVQKVTNVEIVENLRNDELLKLKREDKDITKNVDPLKKVEPTIKENINSKEKNIEKNPVSEVDIILDNVLKEEPVEEVNNVQQKIKNQPEPSNQENTDIQNNTNLTKDKNETEDVYLDDVYNGVLNLLEENGLVNQSEKEKARKLLILTNNQEEIERVSPSLINDDGEDQSEPIARRTSNRIFAAPTYDSHKTIGVWSPLSRVGTTTFTMNFAMYLGDLKYSVAVLEGITNNIKLKSLLENYKRLNKSCKPETWESWASTLFKTGDITDEEISNVKWLYNNVSWLPLDTNDPTLRWNYNKMYSYINTVKKHNLVFVDFPSREMDEYSLFNLDYIDELWIIMDNDIKEMLKYKKYIHKLVQSTSKRDNISTQLICLHELSFTKANEYATELELPLLASCPALYEEVQKNLTQNKPLIKNPDVLEKLMPSFEKIRNHIEVKPDRTNSPRIKQMFDRAKKFLFKH
ncbi:hypothetical protein [Sutcliffiella cohnii]|uniref:hypothetical protein n=1 Tax=Sutcliffiella cohnii TaxID=33932 RepID=UPI0008319640|nr:hypothetical protein [Sutcliffiella cohnii]